MKNYINITRNALNRVIDETTKKIEKILEREKKK